MKEKNYDDFIQVSKEKVDKTFFLVEASLYDLDLYDLKKVYTPKELEPYDALADRFIRCIEVFIRFFKAYEYQNFADKSPTLRDGLNVMEKVGLVTNTPIWMGMRDVRNRIVHDYLPEQTKDMFDSIMTEFYQELKFSKAKIDSLNLK